MYWFHFFQSCGPGTIPHSLRHLASGEPGGCARPSSEHLCNMMDLGPGPGRGRQSEPKQPERGPPSRVQQCPAASPGQIQWQLTASKRRASWPSLSACGSAILRVPQLMEKQQEDTTVCSPCPVGRGQLLRV